MKAVVGCASEVEHATGMVAAVGATKNQGTVVFTPAAGKAAPSELPSQEISPDETLSACVSERLRRQSSRIYHQHQSS